MFKDMQVISDTKAIVRVFKWVRIFLVHDFTGIGGTIHFHVNRKLSDRGSDFKVYANTGYEKNADDSDLLVAILNNLLTPSSGVERIDITPFTFTIIQSRAVTVDETVRRILEGASDVGYTTHYLNFNA